MTVLKRIKHSLLRVFEISSDNGLISIYALRRARGKGAKPDPQLEALLTHNAQRLKEKQEMAKLVSRGVTPKQEGCTSESRIARVGLKFQLATTGVARASHE